MSVKGYDDAVAWIAKHRPQMSRFIRSLGDPIADERIPTAAVVLHPNNKIYLHVNDKFLIGIGAEASAAVLMHEFRHVLLQHLHEARDSMYKKTSWTNQKQLEVAHELIINDLLRLNGYKLPSDCLFGEKFVPGTFFGYMTTEQAYSALQEYFDKLKEEQQDQGSDSDENQQGDGSDQSNSSGGGSNSGQGQDSDDAQGGKSQNSDGSSDGDRDGSCGHNHPLEQDEDGNLKKAEGDRADDALEKMKEAVKKANQDADLPADEKPSDEQADKLDNDLQDAIQDNAQKQSVSKQAGTEVGEIQKIMSDKKIAGAWLKIIKMVNPNVGKQDGSLASRASYNWARTRRSTSLIRGANLPTYADSSRYGIGGTRKPAAIIAFDFSGSIPRDMTRVLAALGKSIPQKSIDATCYTFSTYLVPFDMNSDNNQVASGGTNFACIHSAALEMEKKTGEYPFVICLTDGQADFGYGNSYPTDRQLARWIFVDVFAAPDAKPEETFRDAYPVVQQSKFRVGLPYKYENANRNRYW